MIPCNYEFIYTCDQDLSTDALNSINTYLLNRGYHSQLINTDKSPVKLKISWDLHQRKKS